MDNSLYVSEPVLKARKANLFNPKMKYTGVATCNHSKFGRMTVINYAETFKLNAGGTYVIQNYIDWKNNPNRTTWRTRTNSTQNKNSQSTTWDGKSTSGQKNGWAWGKNSKN